MADLYGAPEQLAPDVPRGLGAAMAGGKGALSSSPREAHEFYPTPPDVTRALLEKCVMPIALVGPLVWEPCGRGGAIVRVLRDAGFPVVASDIVGDADNGVQALDLLTAKKRKADVVVTNPPFALAAAMVEHLLGTLGVSYMALLLKSTFWHAKERNGLWRRHRPSHILALDWRPDFLGRGAPTMEVIWCIWDRRHIAVPCSYDLLHRPADAAQPDLALGVRA